MLSNDDTSIYFIFFDQTLLNCRSQGYRRQLLNASQTNTNSKEVNMSSPAMAAKSKGSSRTGRKSYRQRKMEQEAQSGDKTFKEIKRQINKRNKKFKDDDDVLEEM